MLLSLPKMRRDHRDLADSRTHVLLVGNTLRRWRITLGVGLSVIAGTGSAAAGDGPAPRAADWVSHFWELRALGGGAAVEWSNSGAPVVDEHAAAFGLGLRAGLPLGSHVHFGGAASMARYSNVGQLNVRDAEMYADEFWLRETSYTLWAPFGLFVEIYPVADQGFFLGLTGSLGWIPANSNPPPNTIDRGLLMAGYAIEAGYELDRLQTHGPGVFLRYAGWAGRQSPFFTDFPDEVDSRELTLGLRWTLRIGTD